MWKWISNVAIVGNGQDITFANKVTPLAYQDQSGPSCNVHYKRVDSQHREGCQVLVLVRAQHLG
jgi:hypothetical protein